MKKFKNLNFEKEELKCFTEYMFDKDFNLFKSFLCYLMDSTPHDDEEIIIFISNLDIDYNIVNKKDFTIKKHKPEIIKKYWDENYIILLRGMKITRLKQIFIKND